MIILSYINSRNAYNLYFTTILSMKILSGSYGKPNATYSMLTCYYASNP